MNLEKFKAKKIKQLSVKETKILKGGEEGAIQRYFHMTNIPGGN